MARITTHLRIQDLTQRLQTSNRELALLNQDLEDRVRKRTMALEESKINLKKPVALLETQQTELQQAKETAENARQVAEIANEAKSRFLANVSHELRTPLKAR